MGFWNKIGKIVDTVIEKGPDILDALQQERAKKQASMQKEAQRRLDSYEQKVTQASQSSRMSDRNFARKVQEEKDKIDKAKLNLYTGNIKSNTVKTNSNGEVTFSGLTVTQWDSKWISIGTLSSLTLEDLSQYNKNIGLYKAEMNGQVVYLGKAVEYNNGGLRKRLRDYIRNNNSARTHGSGKKMNEYANYLRISILIVGSSAEDVETVVALERAMIMKHKPSWNVQYNRG